MNKQKIFLRLIISGILLLSLWGCGETEQVQDKAHSETEEHHDEEQIVKLTPQVMQEFGVETAVAGPGELQVHVTLPGEVIIPPDNLAHIHPRFPGIVKDMRKHIGDRVKKGEVLAIIESNESLAEYAIKSLIDGTVVEKHLTRGEVVDDSEHGFVIADLSTVWIYLQVYQKDLPYVRVGQKVRISAGKGLPEVESTIRYISPIVDEITRTVEARVVLRNNKGFWKPGLFVSGRIVTESIEVGIAVPKTALENFESKTIVFVKKPDGFKPQAVHINRENDTLVEIVHGLKAGDVYVSKGGFTLKAELLKSEFGEEDEH